MSDDPRFSEMESFPSEDGLIVHRTSLSVAYDGYGILTSQNGDDLHEISLSIALGDDPKHGFVCVDIDAGAARALARHLLHLADYAELGMEAEPYE